MGIPLTPVTNTQTFGTWLQRTNDLVAAISGNVVTTDSSVVGSVTTGNAFVNGTLGANTLWVGNSAANGVLTPTTFTLSVGVRANSSGFYHNNYIYANGLSIASGLVTINTIGAVVANSLTTNLLTIGSYFTANTTAVNAQNITVVANVDATSLKAVTRVVVGNGATNATITSTAYTVGNASLSTGNLVIGGASSAQVVNVHISNSSGNVAFGPVTLSTSWGISANTTALYTNNNVSNNLTVNTTVQANSSGLFASNLTSNLVTLGVTTINTTSITVGNVVVTNLYANAVGANNIGANGLSGNTLSLGNSSVNCTVNSTSFFIGNGSYIDLKANSSGVYTNSSLSVSGDLLISGNLTSTGTTVGTGDYIPASNAYALGNTTNRWIIWGVSANLTTSLTVTSATGSVNIGSASVNSTTYTGTAYTANSASYIGSLPAANVVSNANLMANLANYPTTSQLASNLALYTNTGNLTTTLGNYLTIAGAGANIAAYLPTYTGVLNATSISVGNSAINAVVNSTSFKLSNSTVGLTLALPTAAQVTNGQYHYVSSGSGSWVLPAMTTGTFTTTGTAAQNIDSWAMASYYGAEYAIHVFDNNANNKMFTKIHLSHDTTDGYITEFGIIATNATSLGAFATTSNATNVTLNFTPTSSNTTVRWARTIL
jgi:hypothetical protein